MVHLHFEPMQSGAKSFCPIVTLDLSLDETPGTKPGPSWFSLDGLLVPLLKSERKALFCFQAESPDWSGLQFIKGKTKATHLYLRGNMKMLNYSGGCITLVFNMETFQEALTEETWGPA